MLRIADEEDIDSILAIYEPYIRNTAVTFEFQSVTKEIMLERMRNIKKQFPYLVSVMDGHIAGYAYCSKYLEKEGFSWDCEATVYVDERYHNKGVATKLYNALIQIVYEQGYYNIYSLICIPNEGSVKLHKKFGFKEVGVYYNTAYKLGKWRDLLVMEKNLRPYELEPCKPKPYAELDKGRLDSILKI